MKISHRVEGEALESLSESRTRDRSRKLLESKTKARSIWCSLGHASRLQIRCVKSICVRPAHRAFTPAEHGNPLRDHLRFKIGRAPKVQAMLWNVWKSMPEDPGEKARREHSAWLTRALAGTRRYPEIPVRPVQDGGFDELRNRPNGLKLAARWWRMALRRVDIP